MTDFKNCTEEVFAEQCFFYLEANCVREPDYLTPKGIRATVDHARKLAKQFLAHRENHKDATLYEWLEKEVRCKP